MPSLAIDPQSVTGAVKTLLAAIVGIGKVEDRPGGVATWGERRRELQAFWQVSIAAIGEDAPGLGTVAIETFTIRVEGWMPFSYGNPNSIQTWWDLIKAVRDKLRANPTVGDITLGSKARTLPQVVVLNEVEFNDTRDNPLCHHCVVEWQTDRWFDYTAT